MLPLPATTCCKEIHTTSSAPVLVQVQDDCFPSKSTTSQSQSFKTPTAKSPAAFRLRIPHTETLEPKALQADVESEAPSLRDDQKSTVSGASWTELQQLQGSSFALRDTP